jgi:CRISPR-associated protein Csm5
MKQVFNCFLKTLSPIHIGCDEVYEPMGFVVNENKNELTAFDPISLISQMNDSDKKRFSEICSRGTVESILEIYKFLRRRPASGKAVQLCLGFVEHYNKTLSIPANEKRKIQQELNNFAISRTSFLSADDRPYIPGSSLKGSLRTAYLNGSAAKTKVHLRDKTDKQASKELEAKLLNHEKSKIETDPFRLIKVSDFTPVGAVQTKIVYAVNIKKKSGNEAKGPFQVLETILPGNVFMGNIVVDEPLSARVINKPIKLEGLLESSSTFYSREHKREQRELKNAGISSDNAFFCKDNIPIRIGRHSGAESVTIEGHRDIKIMGGKGKNSSFKDHATTLWLASEQSKPQTVTNCKPFGWAELCEISPAMEQDFDKAEKEWRDKQNGLIKKLSLSDNAPRGNAREVEVIDPVPPPPDFVIWENVHLAWSPGDGIITATSGGKKATVKGKEIVPEQLKNSLFGKKKRATAGKVKVEPVGNGYRIVEIL